MNFVGTQDFGGTGAPPPLSGTPGTRHLLSGAVGEKAAVFPADAAVALIRVRFPFRFHSTRRDDDEMPRVGSSFRVLKQSKALMWTLESCEDLGREKEEDSLWICQKDVSGRLVGAIKLRLFQPSRVYQAGNSLAVHLVGSARIRRARVDPVILP